MKEAELTLIKCCYFEINADPEQLIVHWMHKQGCIFKENVWY